MTGPILIYGGAIAVTLGITAVWLGLTMEAPEIRVPEVRTRLDEFAPVYEFHERHETTVHAAAAEVYRAVGEVTSEEILLFRTLVWIRRFGRSGPESILNVPERQPVLEVATRTGFLWLAREEDREAVVGTFVIRPRGGGAATAEWFRSVSEPGWAKAAMNFRIEPDGPGRTRVVTETRVHATDAASRRRFARYWRVIYPGSALIRRMWLRAIRLRAEKADGRAKLEAELGG